MFNSFFTDYTPENPALWILVFSTTALLLLLAKLISGKAGRGRELEKDKSGFWKYHPETQFSAQLPYGGKLDEESEKDGQGKRKSHDKNENKKKNSRNEKSVAVIEFDGDIRARGHAEFAKLVDELLINKKKIKEVVALVNSPGGIVPTYGHLYAEMERIRNAGIHLTVCVDVVAASGGYLMSVPANRIVAAPFAILGSVGVLAFVPNFRGLLQHLKIEPRTFTAGKYKRTVSLTDDAGPEEKAHFQEDLETIHRMFAAAVTKYRPDIVIEKIETGDNWSATESKELGLGLVDEIATSREYLLRKNRNETLVSISRKKGLLDGKLLPFGIKAYEALEGRALSILRAGQ